MDQCVDALRDLLDKNGIDKDAQDMAITKKLKAGPAMIRMLSREELKIEIKKYKNISLKIIAEFNKMNKKVPGYARGIEKEALEGNDIGVGMKLEKNADVDESVAESSLFENDDAEMPSDLPAAATDKI